MISDYVDTKLAIKETAFKDKPFFSVRANGKEKIEGQVGKMQDRQMLYIDPEPDKVFQGKIPEGFPILIDVSDDYELVKTIQRMDVVAKKQLEDHMGATSYKSPYDEETGTLKVKAYKSGFSKSRFREIDSEGTVTECEYTDIKGDCALMVTLRVSNLWCMPDNSNEDPLEILDDDTPKEATRKRKRNSEMVVKMNGGYTLQCKTVMKGSNETGKKPQPPMNAEEIYL